MDNSNDKNNGMNRIKIIKAPELTEREKNQRDIIKSLKKEGVCQKDIDYIINGLNEIEEMIKEKKIDNQSK